MIYEIKGKKERRIFLLISLLALLIASNLYFYSFYQDNKYNLGFVKSNDFSLNLLQIEELNKTCKCTSPKQENSTFYSALTFCSSAEQQKYLEENDKFFQDYFKYDC